MEASASPGVIAVEMPAYLPHRSHLSKQLCKKQKQKQTNTITRTKKISSLQKKINFLYLAKIKNVFQPITDFNGIEHTSYYDPGKTNCWLYHISWDLWISQRSQMLEYTQTIWPISNTNIKLYFIFCELSYDFIRPHYLQMVLFGKLHLLQMIFVVMSLMHVN